MRRFSKRNHLVTLSDLNLTPLMDLAFVLLIIFIITTPLLEKGIELNLPGGGRTNEKELERDDIQVVEVTPEGHYRLNGEWMSLDQVEVQLVRAYSTNLDLVVYIRADEQGLNKDLYAVLNRCQRNDITRVSLRTEPRTTP